MRLSGRAARSGEEGGGRGSPRRLSHPQSVQWSGINGLVHL